MTGGLARGSGRLPLAPGLLIALLVGLAISQQPLLTVLLIAGGLLGLLGLFRPLALVAFVFLGVLFDRAGLTGAEVDEFPITASKLAVVGSLGLWGLHAGFTGSRLIRWHPVLSALLGLVATTGFCTAWAGSMAVGKFTLLGLAMMSVLVALVYVVLAERPLQPLYRIFAAAMVGAMALSVLRPGGAGEDARATGTMGDPNEWASMVLLLVPALLGGLADDEHRLARLLRLGLVVLTPLAVLASASRSALLVGLLIAPACIWILWRRRRELGLAGLFGLMAAPFVGSMDAAWERFSRLVGRFTGQELVVDGSLDERMELQRQGMELFLEHWLIGVGPGNFARATGFVSEQGRLRPAHNTFLEIASEQGLLGLAATAILAGTIVWTLWSAFKHSTRVEDRHRLVGMAAGLGAFALMAATLNLLTFSMAYLVLGIALAVAFQARRPHVGV